MNTERHSISNDRKEDVRMAVLAQDVRVSFEISPEKVQEFLKRSSKSAFECAMERASLHQPTNKKKEQDECTGKR